MFVKNDFWAHLKQKANKKIAFADMGKVSVVHV